GTWYLVAHSRSSTDDRLYRVSRITEVVRLPHGFERPDDFALDRAWHVRKEAFAAGIPHFVVMARVSEAGRHLVHLLQEGTPSSPLPDPDDDGWTTLTLRFERLDAAARLLLQLGADIEVVEPGELRDLIRVEVGRLQQLYAGAGPG
ncbi:MAG: WYL domain-containing protein, partial [Acidimicrobiaceae bacterium]|nr:WYL domain-containing protein [Acidimicrobiaceae bacterium]